MVAFEDASGLRAGQRGDEVRQFHFGGLHGRLLRDSFVQLANRVDRYACACRVQLQERKLVDAEEARAFVRGLAVQRRRVLRGKASFVLPADLPSLVSSTMIPESDELLADVVGALEIAAALGGVALLDQGFDCSAAQARLARRRSRDCASFSSSSSASTARMRVEFLHGGDGARSVLLAESRRGPWRC